MLAAELLINMPSSLLMRIVLFLTLHVCCLPFLSLPLSAADVPFGTQAATGTGQKLWCVANPSAPDSLLMTNLNFACGEGGADCTQILQGNACYQPNTIIAHASYAMNMYYQKHGRNYWNCYFQGSGLVVFTDPSYGGCTYPPQ